MYLNETCFFIKTVSAKIKIKVGKEPEILSQRKGGGKGGGGGKEEGAAAFVFGQSAQGNMWMIFRPLQDA